MPQPTLHPNLARLAAGYDQIFERWQRGELRPADVRLRMQALVARDDDGVQWRIDPDTGGWQRQTISGQWVTGVPPAYGYPTATPWELSGAAGVDPSIRVRSEAVDESLLYGPMSLRGATRRPQQLSSGRTGAPRLALAIVVLFLLLAIGAAFWFARNDKTGLTPTSAQPVPSALSTAT